MSKVMGNFVQIRISNSLTPEQVQQELKRLIDETPITGPMEIKSGQNADDYANNTTTYRIYYNKPR